MRPEGVACVLAFGEKAPTRGVGSELRMVAGVFLALARSAAYLVLIARTRPSSVLCKGGDAWWCCGGDWLCCIARLTW
jgi:hypothetical protein